MNSSEVHHAVGPSLTVEGQHGLRLDTDRDIDDLPGRLLIDTPLEVVETVVLGADRDGWPVVADPARQHHPAGRSRYCHTHLNG